MEVGGGGGGGGGGAGVTTAMSSPDRIEIDWSPGPGRKKRKRDDYGEGREGQEEAEGRQWWVKSGLWRVRVELPHLQLGDKGREVVLVAVKLEAFTGERARNEGRGFLG